MGAWQPHGATQGAVRIWGLPGRDAHMGILRDDQSRVSQPSWSSSLPWPGKEECIYGRGKHTEGKSQSGNAHSSLCARATPGRGARLWPRVWQGHPHGRWRRGHSHHDGLLAVLPLGLFSRVCHCDTSAAPGPGTVDGHKERWKNGATHVCGSRLEEREAHLSRHHAKVCGRGNSINRNV